MASPFTFEAILPHAARHVAAYLPSQREDGAMVRADWGIDDPSATVSLLALALFSLQLKARFPELTQDAPDDATLGNAATRALSYLENYQRPSGLTDLRDCNYDSSPDAGFLLQALVPALIPLPLLPTSVVPPASLGEGEPESAAPQSPLSHEGLRNEGLWERGLGGEGRAFADRMLTGMLTGGFHTPNHRWVICGALALCEKLFPERAGEIDAVIHSYRAEGIDIDADGAYIERSAGVYDAICDRSLLLLADLRGDADALEAVRRNLLLNLHLIDADGTTETGLSIRQDAGTRPVPSSLVAPLLTAATLCNEPIFQAAAELLWNAAPNSRDYYGVAQYLLKFGEPPVTTVKPPDSFSKFLPTLGLWRLRREALAVSAYGGRTRLAAVRFGQAELSSIKVSQAYFGVGRFVADEFTEIPGGVRLIYHGVTERRPGYEQPLGHPMPHDEYMQRRGERTIRRVASAQMTLEITEAEGGLDLHLFTEPDAMDRVPLQIAFDFAPGGTWETADTALKPTTGQVFFLKSGDGTMRYGHDAIVISPGNDGHRMWAMRDAEPALNHARVLVTFQTPMDAHLTIRTLRLP